MSKRKIARKGEKKREGERDRERQTDRESESEREAVPVCQGDATIHSHAHENPLCMVRKT